MSNFHLSPDLVPEHDALATTRDALTRGSDAVADLVLIESALAIARDGGDSTREWTDDELHLALTASIDLLNKRIGTLRSTFDYLWERELSEAE